MARRLRGSSVKAQCRRARSNALAQAVAEEEEIATFEPGVTETSSSSLFRSDWAAQVADEVIERERPPTSLGEVVASTVPCRVEDL